MGQAELEFLKSGKRIVERGYHGIPWSFLLKLNEVHRFPLPGARKYSFLSYELFLDSRHHITNALAIFFDVD